MRKTLLIFFGILICANCLSQNNEIIHKIDSLSNSINKSRNLFLRFESDGRINPETKRVIHFTNIYYLDTANNEIEKAYLSEVETKNQEVYYFQNNKLIKVLLGKVGKDIPDYTIYFDKKQVIGIFPNVIDNDESMNSVYIKYTIKAQVLLRKCIPIVSPEPNN